MPAFNFSGLGKGNPSKYGYLISQLDIKQNQLSSDGKLSPGDYNLLIKQARAAYTNPGLSASERQQIGVKISAYQKDQSTGKLADDANITNLNDAVTDDFNKNSMIFGNNPSSLLQANADSLRLKADQLSSSIDSLNNSGADSAAHENEYTKTLQEFQDTMAALNDVKNYKPGDKPVSNYAAFVTTDSKGAVSNVKIGRVGSNSGYVETNGVYGGLPLYGKINYKDGNKNVFQIGNDKFSAADYSIPDPQNPGAMKSNPLVSDDQKIGTGFQGAQAGQYKNVDLSQVRTQTAIGPGQWAKGPSGAYYKANDDGSYTKYVNSDPSKIGVDPHQVLQVPKSFEQNILIPTAKQTVDGSAPINPPAPKTLAPSTSTPQMAPPGTPSAPATSTPDPSASSSTRAPVSRAPTTAGGVAADTQNKAGSFLGNLFGGMFGGK